MNLIVNLPSKNLEQRNHTNYIFMGYMTVELVDYIVFKEYIHNNVPMYVLNFSNPFLQLHYDIFNKNFLFQALI